jgi:peptidyl-prolyl cis-trans isomerase B (cyclophilin B)
MRWYGPVRRAARFAAAAGVALAAGCGEPETPPAQGAGAAPVPVPEASGPRDVAVVDVEGFGVVRFELLPEVAPKTVANFVKLADEGFFDGTTFHRVVPDFVVQAGDPNTKNRDPRDDGRGNPGYLIDDEFSSVSHVRGIVSMANRGNANTGGSQFFVTVADRLDLDRRHAVFGRVVEGMDVVDRIANVPRDVYGRHGPQDRPLEDVRIAKVAIERGAGGTAAVVAPSAAADPADADPDLGSDEWDEGR